MSNTQAPTPLSPPAAGRGPATPQPQQPPPQQPQPPQPQQQLQRPHQVTQSTQTPTPSAPPLPTKDFNEQQSFGGANACSYDDPPPYYPGYDGGDQYPHNNHC